MTTPYNHLNIEDFCSDVARIWLVLLGQFPRKITLYIEDIVGLDQEDEFGLKTDRFLRALSAVSWLEAEGYLRFSQQVKQDSFDDCVLTIKSITLLLKPDAKQHRLSDQLHEAISTPSRLPGLILSALNRH